MKSFPLRASNHYRIQMKWTKFIEFHETKAILLWKYEEVTLVGLVFFHNYLSKLEVFCTWINGIVIVQISVLKILLYHSGINDTRKISKVGLSYKNSNTENRVSGGHRGEVSRQGFVGWGVLMSLPWPALGTWVCALGKNPSNGPFMVDVLFCIYDILQ